MLTVLSWNILAHEWITTYYYKIFDPTLLNRNFRFNIIGNKLINYDSDIILLQEVMVKEYKALKKLLAHVYHISPLNPITWQYRPEKGKSVPESGNVTLLKKSMFSAKHIEHYGLTFGICTKCIYKHAILSIFNIHLDDLSPKKRFLQLDSIKEHLTKNSIIAGDFNQVYRKGSQLYTRKGFKIYNVHCPTYYIERKMNIDNIMYSGLVAVRHEYCEYYPRTIAEKFQMYASDHLPVLAEFQ